MVVAAVAFNPLFAAFIEFVDDILGVNRFSFKMATFSESKLASRNAKLRKIQNSGESWLFAFLALPSSL